VAFQTLSVDLAPLGNKALSYFRQRGYRVRVETKLDLGFPYTPTLACRRQQTTLVVEVVERPDRGRLNEWLGYARSSGQDFRLAIFMSDTREQDITPDDRNWISTQGIGLYVSGTTVNQRSAPTDLALNVTLPDLASAPQALRELLAPSFEQIAGPDWRDGFLSACEILENLARTHLANGIRRRGIQLMGARGPQNPTLAQVNRMTIGQLAKAYARIQSQTHLDAQVGQALERLNPDRVSATHRRRHANTERRLRTNVGRHMYTIFSVVKQLA